MTRYVSPLKRAQVREIAHTTKMVATAACAIFAAVAMAAIAVGAICIVTRIW